MNKFKGYSVEDGKAVDSRSFWLDPKSVTFLEMSSPLQSDDLLLCECYMLLSAPGGNEAVQVWLTAVEASRLAGLISE